MILKNWQKWIFAFIALSGASCAKKNLVDSSSSGKALYVASGLCYSGNGITTFTSTTASNLIYKVNLSTGAPGEILADYNTAGNCGASNTLVTSTLVLPNGKIVYGHASATASSRKISIIAAAGYKVAGDCLSTAAVTVPSYITDMVYLSGSNQLLVSMADSTTGNNMNSIYVYAIDPTTNAITNGQSLLENNSSAGTKYAPYLFGATSMAYDSSDSTLYVAMANSISAMLVK